MRIFLDANVVLDVLADRAPFADDSARVLARVETGAATGLVAAHTVTTLFCLLDRRLGRPEARAAIRTLLRLLEVVPVDEDRLLQALDLSLGDFEDAVQAACAEKAEADVLITRNARDFEGANLEIASPSEFLAAHPGDA